MLIVSLQLKLVNCVVKVIVHELTGNVFESQAHKVNLQFAEALLCCNNITCERNHHNLFRNI